MNSILFLKQCLSEVIVEPVQEAKLRCSICGGHAQGKQWPNQDKGRGICSQCAAKMKTDGREDIGQSYGKEGTHYHVDEASWNKTEPTAVTPFVLMDTYNKTIELEVNVPTIEQAYEKVQEMFGDMSEYQGDYGLLDCHVVSKFPDLWSITNSGTNGTYVLFNKNSTSPTIQKLKSKLNLKENTVSLIITPTGQSDEWSRPVYKGQDGKIYVDINLGNGTPSIHSVTDEGEPDMPIRNYQIGKSDVHQNSTNKPFQLTPTTRKDEWGRPVFRGQDGRIYVDINGGKGSPSIHSVTDAGEPEVPLHNYKIGNGEIVNEGDEADAVHDMHADAEADHHEKYYGNSPKKKALKISKTNTTKKSKAIIKVKGKEIKLENFIKQCLSEVIVEPASRKRKVYGNPQRLQATHFIKECILEVLKDNLTEGGFDPQSQAGPNSPTANPYPEWNNKMAKMEEGNSEEDAWFKYERGYNTGQSTRRTGQKSTPSNSVELVGYQDAILGKKKSIPDIVRNTIKETEPRRIVGMQDGIDDVTETNGPKSDSTEIQWSCPHCKKETQIPVEIESPSDYIACADCEHCGKEIGDPKLDQMVYQKVIDYYAGKADYLKDMKTDGISETDPHGNYAKDAGAGQFDPRTFGPNTKVSQL